MWSATSVRRRVLAKAGSFAVNDEQGTPPSEMHLARQHWSPRSGSAVPGVVYPFFGQKRRCLERCGRRLKDEMSGGLSLSYGRRSATKNSMKLEQAKSC